MSELDQVFARIDASYETTDKLVNYDIAKMAEEEFLFLSDLDLAMHLTLEQRLKVRELFIEDKRYLNKVQDYLIEIGFSKDEAKSLSLKVSSAFIASEQGMSYHDWYTFLAAFSILDGSARFGESLKSFKDLHANWKHANVTKVAQGVENVNNFIKNNVNPHFQESVKNAFGSNIKVTTLAQDIVVYRYHGGTSGGKSYWYTPIKTANPASDLALPPGNTYKYMDTYIIPKGTTILEGSVAPNFGQPGGGYQFYIPDPYVIIPIK